MTDATVLPRQEAGVSERGDFVTIAEIIHAAQARLPKVDWDYVTGGAGNESTVRRNHWALGRYVLRPRIMRNVSRRDISTTFLGRKIALPLMLAPVGSVARYHPSGALAAARVATQVSTASFVSTVASPSLEEIAAGDDGFHIFQLYTFADRPWQEAILRKAAQLGYGAICLTADTALPGRRERDLRNSYSRFRESASPNLAGFVRDATIRAAITWEYIAWVRSITKLPFILKGVMTPEDAALAVQHGVDVVYVSNHGGRQLEGEMATIEVLPEIVDAVGGRAEVVVDGGFVRGSDVVKAFALGAAAVLVGRLMAWALGAGGELGLRRALDILAEEISTTMGLLGVTRLSELTREYVRDMGAAPPWGPSYPIPGEPGWGLPG